MSYQDVKVPTQKGPTGRPISRILLSQQLSVGPAIIYLGRISQSASAQPTRDSKGTSSSLSLLGLAPGGGCLAASVATRAGSLLHYHFTLAAHKSVGLAVCFCGPIQKIASLRMLSGTVLCGVRTFLDSEFTRTAITWPTWGASILP